MHYYKRNIGDYAKKAGRLSMIEHGAYTLLIDSCYDRERFPTLDDAIEWTWARTDEEIAAVRFVLGKFFDLVDGVYVQDRIREEIEKYHENANTNKRIASEREAARRTNRERTVNEPPPNQEPLTKNQEPLTKNQDEKTIANGKPICPHQEIIALYHEILPASPSIRDWTPARAAALRARWNESAERQSLEYWRKLFNYISGIPFLTGKVSSNGRNPFMLSLDWLIKAENFAKVREGRYEDLTQ